MNQPGVAQAWCVYFPIVLFVLSGARQGVRERRSYGHGQGQAQGVGRRGVYVRAVVSSDSRVVAQSMQMRKLGDSDLVISEVTLGTVSCHPLSL